MARVRGRGSYLPQGPPWKVGAAPRTSTQPPFSVPPKPRLVAHTGKELSLAPPSQESSSPSYRALAVCF